MELQIQNLIKGLTNPYTNQNIEVDQFIVEINYNQADDKVLITAKHLGDDSNLNRQIEREVIKICKIDLGIKGVKISYLPETAPEPTSRINAKTKVIAVMSGKGGVGKSNVAVGLAKALANQGAKVGMIDADIYGYSIPAIADAVAEPKVIDGNIMPVTNPEGIEIISAHHFLPNTENKAIIWRGIKLNSLLTHFVFDVLWNPNLDYMVIDMPPGTGDVLLNINNLIDEVNALYVTTPSADAAYVAERVIQVGNELGFSSIGLVENMAYYEVEGAKHYIFGKDGAKTISDLYQLPILASIPIGQELNEYYVELAKKVIKNVK
ncbi:P-loop NTPase [Mollicutes bacterium LVI A0039]|nr:P-loop NTPase [Mollicutes bacterium LVI A0039]